MSKDKSPRSPGRGKTLEELVESVEKIKRSYRQRYIDSRGDLSVLTQLREEAKQSHLNITATDKNNWDFDVEFAKNEDEKKMIIRRYIDTGDFSEVIKFNKKAPAQAIHRGEMKHAICERYVLTGDDSVIKEWNAPRSKMVRDPQGARVIMEPPEDKVTREEMDDLNRRRRLQVDSVSVSNGNNLSSDSNSRIKPDKKPAVKGGGNVEGVEGQWQRSATLRSSVRNKIQRLQEEMNSNLERYKDHKITEQTLMNFVKSARRNGLDITEEELKMAREERDKKPKENLPEWANSNNRPLSLTAPLAHTQIDLIMNFNQNKLVNAISKILKENKKNIDINRSAGVYQLKSKNGEFNLSIARVDEATVMIAADAKATAVILDDLIKLIATVAKSVDGTNIEVTSNLANIKDKFAEMKLKVAVKSSQDVVPEDQESTKP